MLHFPEPLNFRKGFLAHHDGLVPVLANWCYNSFLYSQQEFCSHSNYTEAQIHPIFTIWLHFTQKVVGELPFLLYQNYLYIKEHIKKILSRGFGATLILHIYIKVAPKPLGRIILGCISLVKIQIRILNPKRDFSFLWGNPKKEYESALNQNSIDWIWIRILGIHDPSISLRKDSKKVHMTSDLHAKSAAWPVGNFINKSIKRVKITLQTLRYNRYTLASHASNRSATVKANVLDFLVSTGSVGSAFSTEQVPSMIVELQ